MRRAAYGWLILAGFVLGWDWCCEDTLSQGFYRAFTRRRTLVIVVWGITSAHLFRRLPAKFDPYQQLARLKR